MHIYLYNLHTLGQLQATGGMYTSLMTSGAAGVMRAGMNQMLDLLDPNPTACTPPSTSIMPASMTNRKRVGKVSRATKETSIDVTVNLDGTGKADVHTGIGSAHSLFTQYTPIQSLIHSPYTLSYMQVSASSTT